MNKSQELSSNDPDISHVSIHINNISNNIINTNLTSEYESQRKQAALLIKQTCFILNNETIYPKYYKRLIFQIKKLNRIYDKNKPTKYKDFITLLTDGYIRDNTEWPVLKDLVQCYTINDDELICNKQSLSIPNKYNCRNLYFNSSTKLQKKLENDDNDSDFFTDEDITSILTVIIKQLKLDNILIIPLQYREMIFDIDLFNVASLCNYFNKTNFIISYFDGISFVLDRLNNKLFIIDPSNSFITKKKQLIEIIIFQSFESSKFGDKKTHTNNFKIYNVTNSFTKTKTKCNNKILSTVLTFLIEKQNDVLKLWELEPFYTYKTYHNIKASLTAYTLDSDKYNNIFKINNLEYNSLKKHIKDYMLNHLID